MLATSIPGLALRKAAADDAAALFALVQQNRIHLTALGDYAELVAMSPTDIEADLSAGKTLAFCIMHEQAIVGRADLIAVDPPRYGIGYWLAPAATGRGFATAAVRTLADHARSELGASDLYAGVTHGNIRSVAVLERAGFRHVTDFERYARFHLALVESDDPGSTRRKDE